MSRTRQHHPPLSQRAQPTLREALERGKDKHVKGRVESVVRKREQREFKAKLRALGFAEFAVVVAEGEGEVLP